MSDNLTFFPMREFENLDLEAMSDEELVALQERISGAYERPRRDRAGGYGFRGL